MSINFGYNTKKNSNTLNNYNTTIENKLTEKYQLTENNEPFINEYNSIMTLSDRETFANTTEDKKTKNNLYINPLLYENCKLWIWDFDDTLINTGAYYQHSMEPEYIKYHLTNEQLREEFPGMDYFRDLVIYLVKHGRRVGIATFGVYKIVKAYMDRIFGFGQRYFDQNNIIARSIDVRNINPTIPANKNSYIQRIMNFYKIPSHSQVVLFDDSNTNIGDALILGVIAIQQGDYDDDGTFVSRPKNSNHLFTEDFMFKIEEILQSDNQFNPLRSNKLFGWVGGRRAAKNLQRSVNNEINRNNCEVSKIKVENYYKKELDRKQRIINRLVDKSGCEVRIDGSLNCKLKEQFVPYSVMADMNDNKYNKYNKYNNNLNNKDSNKEDFKCYGCQDQTGSYLIGFMVMLLVGFFAWIVYDNSNN
jgi:hypothetical protein